MFAWKNHNTKIQEQIKQLNDRLKSLEEGFRDLKESFQKHDDFKQGDKVTYFSGGIFPPIPVELIKETNTGWYVFQDVFNINPFHAFNSQLHKRT